MKKLVLPILFIVCIAGTAYAVSLEGDNVVCPGEVVRYTVHQTVCFYQLSIYLTNGTLSAGTSVRNYETCTYDEIIDIQWSSTPGAQGHIGVIAYWGPNGMFDSYDELDVAIGAAPIGPITGAYVASCGEDASAFTVDPVPGATSYEWTSTLGWTTNSNGTTGSFYSMTSTTSGMVSVKAVNANCPLNHSTRTISVSREPSTPFIDGPSVVPPNNNGTFITVKGSNFNWTAPSGWYNMGSQGNYYMQIQAPSYSSSGYVGVTYYDACGIEGSASKFVSTEVYEDQLRAGGDGSLDLYPDPASEVYPNSASDDLYVDPAVDGDYSVTIIDSKGEIVHRSQETMADKAIDIRGLSDGYYYVKVTSGQKVTTRRVLVKER